MNRKFHLLVQAGALALASATAAHAQDTADAGKQSADAAVFGGDIVVTAQRREERLRDVPLSVTALGADTLDKQAIVSLNDLTNAVPGVVVTAGGTAIQPSIRGISTSVGVPGAENNVAVYVDGVYQVSPPATNFQFADIERVEVLKGPQGTLFGRNAAGGAISIITRDPTFTANGKAEVSYGSFSDLRTRGYLSVPLTDTLAVSVSGLYAKSDGYYKDRLRGGRAGGLESVAVRGKILFRPSDSFDMLFSASWIDNKEPGQLSYQPFNGHAPNNTAIPLPTKPWDTAADTLPRMDTTISTLGLRTRYIGDTITVTANTSYTKPHTISLTDADSGPQVGNLTYVNQHADSFQQEIQLATDFDGRFNFVAGLFYLDSNHDFDPVITSGPTGNTLRYSTVNVATKAWAVFGEANLELTEQLTVIAGLRYSWEEKTLSGFIDVNPVVPGPKPSTEVGTRQWSALTPRVSVKYAFNPDSNVYFTYSKGFKSGAWQSTALSPIPIEPETLNAFEIGVKSRVSSWLDIDAAAFHYIYNDQQVQIILPSSLVSLENAAKAKIKGIDFNATAQVTPELSLRAGVAWLDAKYTDFPGASALLWNNALQRNVQTSVNASGNPLIRSPEWTLSGLVSYERELGNGELDASMNLYYSSSFTHVPSNHLHQKAYATIDTQLGYTLENGLRVGVWGKNLTNKAVSLAVLQNAISDRISYRAPRSFGGVVSYSF